MSDRLDRALDAATTPAADTAPYTVSMSSITVKRAAGRVTFFLDAPSGVNRLLLYGFSSDAYTVNEFTVQRVL